jgi:transcriptional regulator of aroF, aroG, tyrA and aromatic amino acid transport
MRLEIICSDSVGMGQKILGIFVEHEINVRGIEFNRQGRIFIDIPDLDFSQLQTFMPQLRLLKGVGDVKTSSYMPSEREKNELSTLIQTFPDPFISIDARGNIRQMNTIASEIIGSDENQFVGQPVTCLLKGFNFSRWLDSKDVLAQTHRLKFQEEYFVADILPIKDRKSVV